MKSDDIISALDVGKKWTRQVKAEERNANARDRRESMYASGRVSLREICFELMETAWNKASANGRLPTHWRMIFYVMRPLVEGHALADRPLLDTTFKNILEEYLAESAPGWDVLRGARGVFKEPHAAVNDNGLAMSTMNVRNYLRAGTPDGVMEMFPSRYPTHGAKNRIAAVLICEKEGFDELLNAEQVPERFDLGLMSTKGISAKAARDLATSLDLRDRVPVFTLHDLDKNGFVMAGGFADFAIDIGLRMQDVEQWQLDPERQRHKNPGKAYANLIRNGATKEEAEFISKGERVELNMLTGPDFIEFVTGKLEEHGVEKVVPDDATLALAWKRAHDVRRVNQVIDSTRKWPDDEAGAIRAWNDASPRDVPPMPPNLAERIRKAFEHDDTQPWDDALWEIAGAES